jgi:non-specific serine/threonine protein kinase
LSAPAAEATLAARHFARFELLALLGKSRRSMAWRVRDGRGGPSAHECFLVLPRQQPADAEAAEHWAQAVRRASRLEHPALAAVLDIGFWQGWPYVLYEATGSQTLAERLQDAALTAPQAAALLGQALQGLAFAHEGGVAHRDLQPYMLLLGEHDAASLMGFEVGALPPEASRPGLASTAAPARTSIDALELPAQRAAAAADLLCAGLLLHRLLAGRPALDETDLAEAATRLPPDGRDLVRLPWTTPLPVPDALRAMANRATDRQPRQRYHSARGLARALEGWLQADGHAGGGPMGLLLDRLHAQGTLPAAPGSEARASRLAAMDRERTNELAQVVLQDLGLAFELLRMVNSAQVRGVQLGGSGPVLTVRRAIAMLGMQGVQRAATALRPWPGPLADSAARALREQIALARRAGRVARALRPAGYDAEVVDLVTLLQSLGRLTAAYHFPDELQQIRRLMAPAASDAPGEAAEAGMDEQAASYAVLGADIEAIGVAVARHWGLDDTVLHLIRRLPLSTQPRAVDNDDDVLRAVASCANEAVDALALPPPQRAPALRRVAQRYGRVLRIDLRDLQDALAAPAGTVAPTTITRDTAISQLPV